MSEREFLEMLEMARATIIDLAKNVTFIEVMADKMADKLIELMGEEAADEWSAPIMEEAEQAALAEVKQMEAEAEFIRAMSEGVCVS